MDSSYFMSKEQKQGECIINTPIQEAFEHLEQQKMDLEISLSISIDHGDAVEEQLSELNSQLNCEIEERVQAEEKLTELIKTITRQRDDLEIALNMAVEHADAIEEHLYSVNKQLNSNLSERDVLEEKLQSLVSSLSLQKQDLELLVETIASHGDEINLEMSEQIHTIENLAKTDPLTGLVNRRAFDDAFEREWLHSKREQTPLSVLMIDIDHFKLFNDAFGHYEGDKCLKQVANAISSNERRKTDVIARFGGEEFIMLLTNCDLSNAKLIAESIRHEVESLQLSNPGSPHKIVTLSIGVSSIVNKENNNAQILLKMADDYLYVAKDSGRNQVYARQL